MASHLIDHAVPLIRAVVIHPDRSDAGASESSRQSVERLEEAVGLARALDLWDARTWHDPDHLRARLDIVRIHGAAAT